MAYFFGLSYGSLAITACALFFPTIVLGNSLHLAKRDPCDGKDAVPIIDHPYYPDSCPPIHSLAPDGSCNDWGDFFMDCESFCQIRKYMQSRISDQQSKTRNVLPR
jgi:hypothetical protein